MRSPPESRSELIGFGPRDEVAADWRSIISFTASGLLYSRTRVNSSVM
jgi:hypothetical protein